MTLPFSFSLPLFITDRHRQRQTQRDSQCLRVPVSTIVSLGYMGLVS